MYQYICKECRCRLDPGEVRGDGMCEECRDKAQRMRDRQEVMNSMVLAVRFEQMRVEEFING